MAVSHAQRRASDAFRVDSCMMRDILSRPSSRMRELSRGLLILFTVACEVGYWNSWKMRYNFVHCSRRSWNSQSDQTFVGYMACNVLQFLIRIEKRFGLDDDHHLERLGGTCRMSSGSRNSEEWTDCWHVGRYNIIRDAYGRLPSINASCMYW